jgi:hypothetical protein
MGKVRTDKLQGEGNYEAAARFNEAEQAFVKAGKVELAASQAAPKSQKEAQELLQAEKDSQKHPKGVRSKTPNATGKPATLVKAAPRKME